VRATVAAGDYAIHADDGRLLAAVERKSLDNLAATLSDGTLAFQLQRLAELPLGAIVVEARYSALFKLEHVNGNWLADQLARLQVRYPGLPIVFRHTPPRRRLDTPLPHHRPHRHSRAQLTPAAEANSRFPTPTVERLVAIERQR
jgi:ERCC4 domain